MADKTTPRRVWIDPNDRPEKEIGGVTFTARIMDVREYEHRKDMVRYTDDEGQLQVRAGTWVIETLRNGLAGWSGLDAPPFDVDGDGHPTNATLGRIHPDVRRELCDWIDRVNTPKAEDLLD